MTNASHETAARVRSLLLSLPLCGPDCRRWVLLLGSLSVVAIVQHEYQGHRWNVGEWDLLLVSGVALYLVGLALVGRIEGLQSTLLRRLHDRGLIACDPQAFDSSVADVEARSDTWSRASAVACCALMVAAFVAVLKDRPEWNLLVLGALEAVLAYVAGCYIGRMIYFGQLGSILRRKKMSVLTDPWHADRAAGLKPIGDLFFRQAMMIALPALYLGVWLVLIPVARVDYAEWVGPYRVLLSVMIIAQVLAFVLPMWFVHETMKRQKGEWRTKADVSHRELCKRWKRTFAMEDFEDREAFEAELGFVAAQYRRIESMPTWPLDWRIKSKFAANTLVLLAPLVIDLAKAMNVEFPTMLETIFRSSSTLAPFQSPS